MVLPLGKAPVVITGLAFAAALVIGTGGYALSQGQVPNLVWDAPGPKIVSTPKTDNLVGPPMPADLAVQATGALSGEMAVAEHAPPDIALRLLNRTYDNDASLAGVPEAAIEVSPPVVAEASTPGGVRVIALPRRDDPTDELGRPEVIGAPPGADVQVADIPAAAPEAPRTGVVADGVTELRDPAIVAPIPAPASQRPPAPVRPAAVATMQPPAVSVQPVLPAEDAGVWPRRLDQVGRQRVEPRTPGRVDPGNLFLSDWVEVRTGAGARIVAK